MSSLIPFSFESRSIRVLAVDGLPWFVAKDVAEALEYAESSNPARLFAHVPDEWKGVNPIHTPGGVQEMVTLSEHGLYFFINRSDKPKALPFQKWVAGDVLPAIRRTGHYGMPMPKAAPETVTMTKDEYLALKDELLELYKTKIEYLESQPRRRMLEDDEKAEILSLHGKGWTPAAIGRQVNRPSASIESFLRRVRLGQEG